jgi:hypothetical protein
MSHTEIVEKSANLPSDVAFLFNEIEKNERYNERGLSETDLSVLLEMSELCDWSGSFTVARFRTAVREMAQDSPVVKRGANWHRLGSTGAVLRSVARTCLRDGCNVDITHRTKRAQYCSVDCRQRAASKRDSVAA